MAVAPRGNESAQINNNSLSVFSSSQFPAHSQDNVFMFNSKRAHTHNQWVICRLFTFISLNDVPAQLASVLLFTLRLRMCAMESPMLLEVRPPRPLVHVCFLLVFVVLRAQFAFVGGLQAFRACRVCDCWWKCNSCHFRTKFWFCCSAICRHRLLFFCLEEPGPIQKFIQYLSLIVPLCFWFLLFCFFKQSAFGPFQQTATIGKLGSLHFHYCVSAVAEILLMRCDRIQGSKPWDATAEKTPFLLGLTLEKLVNFTALLVLQHYDWIQSWMQIELWFGIWLTLQLARYFDIVRGTLSVITLISVLTWGWASHRKPIAAKPRNHIDLT